MTYLQESGLYRRYRCKLTLITYRLITSIVSTSLFTVDIHNVSLIPSTKPLTIQEGTQLVVGCVVDSNAAPAPTITWNLGSANITSIAVTNTTFITLTGNRTNNNKMLQCKATNNNKPPKIASTTLNVECKYYS